jgi:sigma-B regulation protein RsbU (phosphoserine phosphatase)
VCAIRHTGEGFALYDFFAACVQYGMNIRNVADLPNRADAAILADLARLRADLRVARDVQTRLFPHRVPHTEGLDVHGECRPAQDVGGDFYDFVPLDPGGLAVSVGDVSGHGVGAGFLMSGMQALLRALSRLGSREIGRVVHEVNHAVWQTSPDNFFATLFYAYLDPVLGELQYVSAGHESALLVRRRTGRVVRLESTGTVLGLSDRVIFGQRTLPLEAGDLLIAHTDGVTEAVDGEGREFGERGVVSAVAQCGSGRAVDIAREILHGVEKHATDGQEDDRTVVVVRYKGTTEQVETEEEMELAAA